MNRYPSLTVLIERDGETTRLIPRASKALVGSAVEVVGGVTQPNQIERALELSCIALMEQG